MPPAGLTAKRDHRTRVFVAVEPRAYGTSFGRAIAVLRPQVEVTILEPGALEAAVAWLEPELVISNLPKPAGSADRIAWLEYRSCDEASADVCVGGRRTLIENPGLDDLLSVVDQAGGLAGSEISERPP
ncbi:MAG TPA: hypothetical protein VKA73_05320 [Rubrobacter sp.]|nr:hypothetical protein [Rubrobacter sp.]